MTIRSIRMLVAEDLANPDYDSRKRPLAGDTQGFVGRR